MTTYRSGAPDALSGFDDPGSAKGTTLEQLVAFAAVFLITLSNLFFSPFYSSTPTLIVTLGLILPVRRAWQSARPDDLLGLNPVVQPRTRG